MKILDKCLETGMQIRFGLTCLLLALSISFLHSQTDSLHVELGSGVVLSNENNFLPHYLVNNQWGLVQEDQSFFLEGTLRYDRPIGEKFHFSTGFSFRNDLLGTHYFQLDYDIFRFNIGRNQRVVGGLNSGLSSGSMAMSRNARPIPMIEASIPEYVNVPFTKGYFKAKGHMSHGWLEDDRYMANAQLHSKSFYLKLDLSKEIGFTAASGVVHFAQYGGTSPIGEEQPDSFSDFLKVFRGAGIPNPDGTTSGESNGLGNHLGIIETNVTKQLGDHLLTINYQKPFEDEGGIQYVSLTDYLFGLEWELPKGGQLIRKVYIEYIQTKWQGGPGLPDPNETEGIITMQDNMGYPFGGRDNLYNNWLYQDGWTYDSRVIGNPLYLTFERTLRFLGQYPDYDNVVASNRLRAVHLGIEGLTKSEMKIKGLFTFTSNFGTYSGLYQGRFRWAGVSVDPNFEYVFLPAQNQFYFLVELSKKEIWKEKPWGFRLRLALDRGDLYNATGFEGTIRYVLNTN